MAALLDRIRINDAVLWSHTHTNIDGDPVYADPVQIADKVRWETVLSEYTDPISGAIQQASATVYINEDVNMGDVLWQGLLADAPDAPPHDTHVRHFSKLTNAKGSKTLRVAYLGNKSSGN